MYVTEIEKLSKIVPSDCRLFNVYGPSECTCITSMNEVGPEQFRGSEKFPKIGKMNENCQSSLDPIDNSPNRGELVIKGKQVARGYLSGETGGFFLDEDGVRAYRTGDIMDQDHEGNLTFVSRVDRQLKVMGHRVEPAEIEYWALAKDGVEFAACLGLRERESLYLALVYQGGPEEKIMSEWLQAKLPKYMNPRQIKLVDSMPLNPNGKIDYKNLKSQFEEIDED